MHEGADQERARAASAAIAAALIALAGTGVVLVSMFVADAFVRRVSLHDALTALLGVVVAGGAIAGGIDLAAHHVRSDPSWYFGVVRASALMLGVAVAFAGAGALALMESTNLLAGGLVPARAPITGFDLLTVLAGIVVVELGVAVLTRRALRRMRLHL